MLAGSYPFLLELFSYFTLHSSFFNFLAISMHNPIPLTKLKYIFHKFKRGCLQLTPKPIVLRNSQESYSIV